MSTDTHPDAAPGGWPQLHGTDPISSTIRGWNYNMGVKLTETEICSLARDIVQFASPLPEDKGRADIAAEVPEGIRWRDILPDYWQNLPPMTASPADIPADLAAEVLPCDVRLPPYTTIRKGCKLSTLLTGIRARQGRPPEDLRFAAEVPEGVRASIAFHEIEERAWSAEARAEAAETALAASRAEVERLTKQCEGFAQAALNNGQDLLHHEALLRASRALAGALSNMDCPLTDHFTVRECVRRESCSCNNAPALAHRSGPAKGGE